MGYPLSSKTTKWPAHSEISWYLGPSSHVHHRIGALALAALHPLPLKVYPTMARRWYPQPSSWSTYRDAMCEFPCMIISWATHALMPTIEYIVAPTLPWAPLPSLSLPYYICRMVLYRVVLLTRTLIPRFGSVVTQWAWPILFMCQLAINRSIGGLWVSMQIQPHPPWC